MVTTFLPATPGDYFLAGLERFMRRTGQGNHHGVTVLWLESTPEISLLQQALDTLYATHPVLSAKLHRQWRGWRFCWRVDNRVSAPGVVVHPPQLALDDTLIRRRIQGEGITAPLQIEVFAAPMPAVLLSWRHTLLDGIGINLLLEQLAGGIIAPTTETPAKPAPSTGKLFAAAKPAFDVLYRITCEGSRSAWHRGKALTGAPAFKVITLDAAQSPAAFERVRGHCGEVFQMPFYAAVAARVLRRLHKLRQEESRFCHMEVPFQNGKRPPGSVFQNRMGMLLLALKEEHLDALDTAVTDVLAVYKDAMRKGLPQASEALMALTMHMPVNLFIPLIRLQNEGEICSLFHSHTGTFLPGKTTFASTHIRNVYTVPGVSSPPGIGIFFSDYAGLLTITLAWREGCLTSEEQSIITEQLIDDLTGCRHP